MVKITRGLNLPISGAADPQVVPGVGVTRVGVVAADYPGMKPTMLVQVGDRVRTGQPLFSDKKAAGVIFTAPATGVVTEINRGERRLFLSLTIEIADDEPVEFQKLVQSEHFSGTREQVTETLSESGLWTSFRTRPYSKVPAVGTVPRSVFVQAMDTSPLALDPAPLIREREAEFRFGIQAISKLTDGRVYICHAPDQTIPDSGVSTVEAVTFEGPHPAGLPGTHIHFLDPVGPGKVVWTIHAQDVIAIGHLLAKGHIDPMRVITLAGPSVAKPQTLRVRQGACLQQLTAGQLLSGQHRVISGSVLSGRRAATPTAFLGRYHFQVSAVEEGGPREFLGWLSPGADRFSIKQVFSSALDKARQFRFTTTTSGSRRAMVPIGMYEQVMPLDIIPTFLLRSLITRDSEQAQALGCLELDEEDLSLCTFVCPGKTEYGPLLRSMLSQIEKDG